MKKTALWGLAKGKQEFGDYAEPARVRQSVTMCMFFRS